ncbi:OLC1v1030829C1 [Oldenlandia corymbosa var. corymbosa]|uniref:OLC1v1030829C1 n=1 Tax=Oldenlandia corymbosa var. corymbosa TaxID=529605 RepID=A0AAV1CKH4_OLDCO|nr:OLC1v1030829C1 [Oldenlandia corymbosa var. corymbosa]
MCIHDEAIPHCIDMIDQTTLGHRFIYREFGQRARVGWQIGPFGHSAIQAYLLGAELGFDSLFFALIDYQDRTKRKNNKLLEVVWRGSKSLGSSSQIFTGIFLVHYNPSDGFSFEVNDMSSPIQDDLTLFDYNVEERVNGFVQAAMIQELEDGKLLIGLAHLYEWVVFGFMGKKIGEDEDYSVTPNVELGKLFSDRKISKIAEMNLSANQERSEWRRRDLIGGQKKGVMSNRMKMV